MMYLTFALVFVGGICIGLLIYVANDARARHRRPDPRVLGLMKQVGNVRIEVADLRDLYERLMTSHKRLRSSAGMAKLRDMDKESDDESINEFAALSKLGLIKGKPL